MEKIQQFFTENPRYFGVFFTAMGVAFLLAAIYDADWLFKKDVSGSTYSLEKIDGWINVFGRKTARVVVGIMGVTTIIAGIVWFAIYSTGEIG